MSDGNEPFDKYRDLPGLDVISKAFCVAYAAIRLTEDGQQAVTRSLKILDTCKYYCDKALVEPLLSEKKHVNLAKSLESLLPGLFGF